VKNMTTKDSQIAIDRLTGKRFGPEEVARGNWTIESIRLRALDLGKAFNPSPDISGRLEEDLSQGALVLFTAEEVTSAVEQREIPRDWQEDLIDLVGKLNDIAVIPTSSLERWKKQQAVMPSRRKGC
jgi:hypothetical protein